MRGWSLSSSSVTFLYSESGCVWSHTQTRGVLSISVYSILLPLGSVSLIPKTTSARFSSMVFTKWEEKKSVQDRMDIRFVQSEIIQDVRKKRVKSVAHTSYFEGSERTRNSFGKLFWRLLKCISRSLTSGRSSSPSGVKETFLTDLLNRVTFNSFSRERIWCLTAGCVTFNFSAARAKLSVEATQKNIPTERCS